MSENIEIPSSNDHFPEFAISLQEAKSRIDALKAFVRDMMVEGEDFGCIPGTNTKPTLLKPGAEKLNAMFGLAPMVTILEREVDYDKSLVGYEIKVSLLNKRSGAVEAEGVGSCNSKERRYKNQDAANIANTVLKMAKKRALVDATLSATRASGVFTQDIEDTGEDLNDESQPAPRRVQEAARATSSQNSAQAAPSCPKCRGAMWDNREGKTNPKSPDFKCKKKECGEAVWLNDDQQQAPQQPAVKAPPPEHIQNIWNAMRESGTPWTRDTHRLWLEAINTYLNETGDSPAITDIRQIAPHIAGDVTEAIKERLCIFPSKVDDEAMQEAQAAAERDEPVAA